LNINYATKTTDISLSTFSGELHRPFLTLFKPKNEIAAFCHPVKIRHLLICGEAWRAEVLRRRLALLANGAAIARTKK
jgi:1,6-anhydro-N-acetylmuramate kinase